MARMLVHDRAWKAYWAEDDSYRIADLANRKSNVRNKAKLKRSFRRQENRKWRKEWQVS